MGLKDINPKELDDEFHKIIIGKYIEFDYTNWKGVKSNRKAKVHGLQYGFNEWHPTPQAFVYALDIVKNKNRSFAIKDMSNIKIIDDSQLKYHPIGIMPRKIWDVKVREERLKELLAAMKRYEDANIEIPNEWRAEYLDLTKDLKFYNKETFWLSEQN